MTTPPRTGDNWLDGLDALGITVLPFGSELHLVPRDDDGEAALTDTLLADVGRDKVAILERARHRQGEEPTRWVEGRLRTGVQDDHSLWHRLERMYRTVLGVPVSVCVHGPGGSCPAGVTRCQKCADTAGEDRTA